jgi:hypothetical protein
MGKDPVTGKNQSKKGRDSPEAKAARAFIRKMLAGRAKPEKDSNGNDSKKGK